jgi:ubiquinone/menaquinone biosynthesis C-methylase UbiE
MTSQYIHGTEPGEQNRLEKLNQWVNERCLAAMALKVGDHVVDFGSGLGNLTEQAAIAVGPGGRVVGIEHSDEQIAVARSRSMENHRAVKPEYRSGSVENPPFAEQDWGSFDLAHARFVLQHLVEPVRCVQNMVRSVRAGGRIILADDDHALFRHWPECPGLDAVWTAYQRAFERNGNDSIVGRRLVQLLSQAGATPVRNDLIFFGSCSGNSEWGPAIQNLIGVLRSAKERMVRCELIDDDAFEHVIESIALWKGRTDAAMWYAISWAEGVRKA